MNIQLIKATNEAAIPATIYLADNSRLLPSPQAQEDREHVEALCKKLRLDCSWPSEHFLFPDLLPLGETIDFEKVPTLLAKAPFVKIYAAHAVIAEFTPFRGPHLNPQIAFELGIACAIGLPIFAWTYATYPACPAFGSEMVFSRCRRARLLDDRIHSGEKAGYGDHWFDEQEGMLVEQFGLVECAAIAGNVQSLSLSIEAAIEACAQYFRSRRDPKGG